MYMLMISYVVRRQRCSAMASRIMAAYIKRGSNLDLNDLERGHLEALLQVSPALADSTPCSCWHCPSQ